VSKKESSSIKKKRLERSFQVILGSKVSYRNPAPDIYTARVPIATASWINTEDGTVVIDDFIIQFPVL